MNKSQKKREAHGLCTLIIGINFAPEMISTGVYTTGMAQFLARRGHKVGVISAHPYYPEWRVRAGWSRLRYVRPALDQAYPSLSVTHCPLYVPRRPTGLRRILHHASFALTSLPPALASALSRARPDVIIVVAPSLLSALTGLIAARMSGANTWLHIQDLEVEAALATGLLKPGGRLGRLALAFERFVLKRFDRVSSISVPMLAKLPQKGVARDRVRELRNWADLDLISPGPIDAEMRLMLGIRTPHVVLYSGNLANKQGLEILPKVARLLSHRGDITMLICGDGPMRSSLHQACKDLPNVKFAPLQPKERLGALLRAADLHLLPQIAGAADLVLPSKLKNMLASGRPIVVTANPGTALAVEVGNAGIVTPPGDATAFAQAICELVDDPVRRLVTGRGNILVTGGAGYIGSHACKALKRAGYTPVTLDNFSTGWRHAVKFGPLVEADLLDRTALDQAFAQYKPEAVMHFAALSQVGESVTDPGKYWRNNVMGSLNLIEAAVDAKCKKFIFSSTCATYGEHDGVLITEETPQNPTNAYGASKLAVEQMLKNFEASHGLKSVMFRYFNVAGADPEGEIGECHEPETHLIPLAIRAAMGLRRPLKINGTDYATPDGTCVRD